MKKALLLLFLTWCAALAAAAPKKPKLIVTLVVDQFRYDYLTRFRPDYTSGLVRLLEHGAVFTDAHHIAAPTVTAIGHSTVLSGATPALSGIAGNEWYDRETKHQVTSVNDETTQLIGGAPGRTGSSPHRLLVSTLGDEIKMHGEKCKVIGISIKDRSAILPGGHMADGAYWFEADTDSWVTSSYYAKELPAWVKDANAQRPGMKYSAESWFPFDAVKGVGKPYCSMVAGADVRFCGSIEATPWGNEMIEQFAERAVVAEKMGKHEGTDILSVSFSSNDYVGHALGPDAPEVRDISIRTDRLLGKFFTFLEQKVGLNNIIFVMTADHGVAPLPELNVSRRMPGGRLKESMLVEAAQGALSAKYGAGKWVIAGATAALYLNNDLIESKKLDRAEVQETAAVALRKLPHAFRVFTGEELTTGRVRVDFVTTAFLHGYVAGRSADIMFLADPFYVFAASGATHGTPYNYDTHVPVIFMGAGIKPGKYYGRVAVNDIAPTLASILGVQFPSGSVGRVLSEMFE